MSRKPSFTHLRGPVVAPAAPRGEPAPVLMPAPVASRTGRKQIAGFFSPEMSLAMHMLARRQGRSLQALMAEAFNDILRRHGESPIGD